MNFLKCGDCAAYPCDSGGGHLKSDRACSAFFKPWKFSEAVEDAEGNRVCAIEFLKYGPDIHCIIRHSVTDDTHKTEAPVIFNELTTEAQNTIFEKIIDVCAIKDRAFIRMDLAAIFKELQAQHWYPKERQQSATIFQCFNGGKFNVKAVSEYILKHVPCKALEDTGELLYYDAGVYCHGGERIIGRMVQNLLGDRSRKSHQAEVINWIRHETYTDRSAFNPVMKLNLLNGVLDLYTGVLCAHSPEMMFTIQHPVNYDPGARCPKISAFLSDILDDDKANTVCEFAGYSLTTDTEVQKAMIIYGAAGAGKSTLLNLIAALVGHESVSNESLHSLENDRFAAANLCDKTLNIFPDLPDRSLSDIPVFKQIVGGDRLRGEVKFQSTFVFKPTVKMLFSANALPPIRNMDDAKSRRLILVRVKGTVPTERTNRHLLKELTAPDELSGFLNLVLKGLKRLWDSGHYSYEMSTEETKLEYIAHSDPVKAFAQECIVFSATDNIKKKEMLEAFCVWCDYHGIEKLTEQQLSRGLTRLTYTYNQDPNGTRERHWNECSFSDKYYEILGFEQHQNNRNGVVREKTDTGSTSEQDKNGVVRELCGQKQQQDTSFEQLQSISSINKVVNEIEKENNENMIIGGNKLFLCGLLQNIEPATLPTPEQLQNPNNFKSDGSGKFCVGCGSPKIYGESECGYGRHKWTEYRCKACYEQKICHTSHVDASGNEIGVLVI